MARKSPRSRLTQLKVTEMKTAKKLIAIIIIISTAASALTFSAAADAPLAYGAATVNTPILNLRAGPSTDTEILARLTEGEIVVVLEQTSSEWYKVNYHGTLGYVSAPLLRDVLIAENFNARGRVTGDVVNLRERPNVDSEVMGQYFRSTEMTVIGINTGWYKVQHDGKTGYVRSDYMEIIAGQRAASASSSSSPPANLTLGQQIANFALTFLGSTYVYGGASPSGFDCSGLSSYVYRHFGYTITRNASGQYRDNGVRVDKQNLAPGDLVFFSSNGGASVTHVGIYIGDNEFVHASRTGIGVIISRLDSSYYINVWYGAKRII